MKSIFRRFGLPHLVAVLAVALVLGSGAAYAANQITSKNIKNNTIKSVDVKDSALTGTDVAADTLTAADLAANSVGTSEILDSTITTIDVAADTLTAADLAPNSVGTSEIADNTVGQNDIATDGVAATEIQDNSIDAGEIIDNSLFSGDLGAGSVRGSELGTITTRDATSANIAPGATGSTSVACLAGERIITGGNDTSLSAVLIASRASGNGWAAFVRNDGGANITVTVHAYCLQTS